jgi:DNA-binding NtrC family response regulator
MDAIKTLLVDDEAEFRETLLKRLAKRRLEARGVASGEAALAALQSFAADVILLDVRMPGMDGIETLRSIKKIYPLVEVIMLTGHASMEAAIEGMELGAFDYLMKPMDIDSILFKIQDAYERRCLQQRKIRAMQCQHQEG